jgi:sigma-E factor negative regulatory protein RseA
MVMAGTDSQLASASRDAQEALSALADGELSSEVLSDITEQTAQSGDVRLSWYSYHLVGDVLRTGLSLSHPADAAMLGRLRSRLSQEERYAHSLDTTESIASDPINTGLEVELHPGKAAANDARFSWRLAGGVACLLLVASLGWQMGLPWAQHARDAQLAGATRAAPVTALRGSSGSAVAPQAPPTQLRDPKLDAVLQAQRPPTSVPASPGAAGLVRNATFEGVRR